MSWAERAALLDLLWAILAAIAIAGGWVAYRAWAAYRVRRSTPLLLLGAGLGVIAVGMPLLWVGMFLATDDPLWCSLVAMAGLLVGVVLLAASVVTRRA
ncbi:MAG: DUF7521 family protein [Thermoplasmata archaeon]